MKDHPSFGPVRDCILCGTPTRGDLGIFNHRPGIGMVMTSVPLCCLHKRFSGMSRAADACDEAVKAGRKFKQYVVEGDYASNHEFLADLLFRLDAKPVRSRRKRKA